MQMSFQCIEDPVLNCGVKYIWPDHSLHLMHQCHFQGGQVLGKCGVAGDVLICIVFQMLIPIGGHALRSVNGVLRTPDRAWK